MLLGEPKYDASRVALLLARTAGQAESLERVHFPLLDQPLDNFGVDLPKEAPSVVNWAEFCRGTKGVSFDGNDIYVSTANERARCIRIK